MTDHPQHFVELLVLEDLCSGEGSLQTKKLKKTLEFRFKTVNDFKVSGNFLNFLSFKKKRSSLLTFLFLLLYTKI